MKNIAAFLFSFLLVSSYVFGQQIPSKTGAKNQQSKAPVMLPKTTDAPVPQAASPYKNANLPIADRVKDLLGRMTLEEKVAQIQCHWETVVWGTVTNAQGDADYEKWTKFAPNGLGQLARPSEMAGFKSRSPFETATYANQVQKYFVEKTRLGIPIMFHEESLHGNQAKDATLFPTHLALGSTWNEALLTEIYTAIAEEIRLRGGHQVLAPVVDLARDPRWGRTEECLGEDPYHVSRMAVAEIKAYQGGANVDKIPARHVISTLKHFGVHGNSEGGLNVSPSFRDERTMREVYFQSFETCVKQAGALGLMPCYNEQSGVPAHADKWLLTDVLRGEWGFKGIIVSDYDAIKDLVTLHHVAANADDAAAQAINAGVDIETPNAFGFGKMADLVKNGKISQATLDATVSRVLSAKFQLGLFENPYTDAQEAQRVIGCDANRKLAYKAATESMVLLKNDNNLLPLQKGKYKRIAIVGPNADRCILGGYASIPKQTISPLQSLKNKFGNDVELIYTEGVRLTDAGDWFSDSKDVKATPHEANVPRIQEAIKACQNADIILYFGGSNEAIFREGWASNHFGDLTDIDLFGDQNELILALKKLNKPMAGFVFTGSPLACNTLNDNTQALVQCWFLGQETGDAVADLILGNIVPSGKLSMTIPRSVGHIPAYYSYKPSARRGYAFDDVSALYPFGHGLSYTTFAYTAPSVSKTQIGKNESFTVSVSVKNTGSRDGAEVVQLYIHDLVSSVTRPIKELKDFTKINLKAGESQTVTFTITPDKLSFYGRDMKKIVEAGEFEIIVGTSSAVNQMVKVNVVD
jgi:beta-glucosidase